MEMSVENEELRDEYLMFCHQLSSGAKLYKDFSDFCESLDNCKRNPEKYFRSFASLGNEVFNDLKIEEKDIITFKRVLKAYVSIVECLLIHTVSQFSENCPGMNFKEESK